jgi:hypothetical protein
MTIFAPPENNAHASLSRSRSHWNGARFLECSGGEVLPTCVGWKIRPRPGDALRQHLDAYGVLRKNNKLKRCQLIKIG